MMPELDTAPSVVPPPAWPAAARRVARTAAAMFVGASAFLFWALVVAHVWLGARPFGRLVWEPYESEKRVVGSQFSVVRAKKAVGDRARMLSSDNREPTTDNPDAGH